MSPTACPVCETARKTFTIISDNRVYHACPNCQLIQMDGANHVSLEKQKERYLEHNNSEENQGYVDMFGDFIAEGVKPFVPQGGRLLDFGCGPEPVLAGLLRKQGYSVDTHDLFFDPNRDWEGKTYDLITLTEVLEHLPHPLETLSTLTQRLAPKGIFSIMTLFHPDDQESFSQWWYCRDPTHVSFFTPQTIGEMARALGMKTVFTDSKRVIVLGK